MSKTINAGRVTFVPKDNFSNNINYKKFDIVTYNGSSYFAKKDTIGHTPTEEEFWQLVAEKGQNGEPGAVKMQVVDTLPETGETDTIYLVKKDNPGEQNLYDEYVYTDTGWEHIGDTSVDLTDYYTKDEVNDKLATISKVYYWEEGNTGEESIAIFQEMINDLINGGNPILSNKYSNDSSASADYRIGGSNIYTFPTDLDITTLSTYTGEIDLRRFGYSTVGVTSGKVSRTWVYYKIMIVLKNGVVEKIAGPFKSTAYFNNNSWEGYGDTTILCAENTMAYTPTSDYNPATKKYVDDRINDLPSSAGSTPIYNFAYDESDFYCSYNSINYVVSTNEKNVNRASEIINDMYTNGFGTAIINFYNKNSVNAFSYVCTMQSGSIHNKSTTFTFMAFNKKEHLYTQTYDFDNFRLDIDGTWTDDVFTADEITCQGIAIAFSGGIASVDYVNNSISSAITTTLEGSY